jgi:photosystem II stability/assembly factor-like uncharacterized protein
MPHVLHLTAGPAPAGGHGRRSTDSCTRRQSPRAAGRGVVAICLAIWEQIGTTWRRSWPVAVALNDAGLREPGFVYRVAPSHPNPATVGFWKDAIHGSRWESFFSSRKVGGRSDATATVLSNGLGYAKARDGRLWRTVDGGRTWRPTAVRDVFQITATSTSAWALRERGGRVWLVRSEDGGRTWHTRRLRVGGYEGPAVGIAFADAADGVMSGLRPRRSGADGKPFLLVTRNGRRTWTERRDPCSPDAVGFKGSADVRWLASGTLWLVCIGAGGAGAEVIEVHTG